MKIYKVFTLLLCLICLISCKDKTEIQSIRVFYYNYIFLGEAYNDCNDMKKRIPTMKKDIVYNQNGDSISVLYHNNGVLDTTLTDPKLLENIKSEINKLKKDTGNNSLVEARISCEIIYFGGRKERICLSGMIANVIYYNGEPQKKNNRLLFLIKKNIGYYYWIDKRYLECEDELNDQTIKRDSIVNKFGFKY